MQKEENLSSERINGETKSTNEVSFIKAHFVSVGVTSPIVNVGDPNFYRRRELEPIPNPLFILLPKKTTYILGFMRGRTRSDFKGPTVLRRRQSHFKLARPNLTFSKHYERLGNSHRTINSGEQEK